MELLSLFLTFAKIGAITFGGGLAMLPILQREIVDKHGWATEDELLDYYAIGQCTPGIIAVNVATFIGHKQKGTLGAIFSTLGVIFPSIVIITVIAAFIQNFLEYEIVGYALTGVRVCVVVLIADAVTKLMKKTVIDIPSGLIFLGAFLLAAFTSISVVMIVIIAGIVGISVKTLRKKREGEK